MNDPSSSPRLNDGGVNGVRRMLVALDGSADSLAAAAFAASLARVIGAEVVALHAVSLLETWEGGAGPLAARERMGRMAAGWIEPFVAAPLSWRIDVRDGAPVETILAAARDHDVQLIVVGSRGAGGVPAKLLGSTSTQVTQLSDVPVLVVPRRADVVAP